MIVPTPSTSKTVSSSTTSTNTTIKSPKKGSSSSSTAVQPSTSKQTAAKSDRKLSTDTVPPPLLTSKAQLPPLEDLTPDLPPPTITNNYKPMPLNPIVMDCVFRGQGNKPQRMMTDEEAFGASISSKTMRTKVYSGVKTGSVLQVPTLHEMCIRILQKNIDSLEYTGGVPFEILKPVLERATPDQLYTFEHFNPYLMEDSDVLWQQHCQRQFRGLKRQEMETWRDMYHRCRSEREARLNSLTENIKHSQSVAVPLKQTKLAYIDSMVKPPRSVIKKQSIYGTERRLTATPASRVVALNAVAPNITKVGDVRLKTLAAIRDTAQAQASNGSVSNRGRKAPLMAKTIQLMKCRFKR